MTSPPLALETVRRRLQSIRAHRSNVLEACAKQEAEVKARCPHDWRYEPDPSGNNDSTYECSVCGAQSKRRQTP